MPRNTLTQPAAARAESALMMGQVRATVFSGIMDYYGLDEADDYDQEEASGITAAVMEYLEPEVERLSGHPAAAFLASGDAEHLVPHRLVWQNGDRLELRCPGRDGGLECHMILNHNGRCHG